MTRHLRQAQRPRCYWCCPRTPRISWEHESGTGLLVADAPSGPVVTGILTSWVSALHMQGAVALDGIIHLAIAFCAVVEIPNNNLLHIGRW